MGKYDAELDLSARNSLYMIVRHLRAGTRILELGPANGRLTRYLSGELGCTVDIVELDEESGRQAARYADQACLGPQAGDIDAGLWAERLADRRYDYIVCADVLEHLRDPGRALGRCLPLLAAGGALVASVPNIAHNAVLIGLMCNAFRYTQVGLLDNTHIHFFTRQSFREMAVQQGYAVVSEEATYVDVPDTELGVSYGQIERAAARSLKCRPDGIAYQYIFELKRSADACGLTETVNIESWSPYICEGYPLEQGQADYTAAKKTSCRLQAPHVGSRQRLELDLSSFGPLSGLRLDPLNANCVLRLHELVLLYGDEAYPVSNFALNGRRSGDILLFAGEDPQIFIELPRAEGLQAVRLDYELLCFDDEIIAVAEMLLRSSEERFRSELEQPGSWTQFKRFLKTFRLVRMLRERI